MICIRRYFIISLVLLSFLPGLLPVASAAKLYVFYPTDVRPKSLQGKINTLCPEVQAIAFGRVVDFFRQIDQFPPNAILSLNPVVTRKNFRNNSLKGSRNGHYDEEYVLVSLDKPVNLQAIEQLKIGVLDILGRKPMKHFMNELFDSKIHIKRVIKTEDFLPLLTFRLADAIFVSRSSYQKLQKKSRQKLVVTKTGIHLGLAMTGMNQESNNEISRCIEKLDEQTNALLGVDQWEKQP